MIHEASNADRLGFIALTTPTGRRWLKAEHIMGLERDQAEDFTVVQMLIGSTGVPITVKEFPEEVLQAMVDQQDAEATESEDDLKARIRFGIEKMEREQQWAREVYDDLGLVHTQSEGMPPSTFRMPRIGDGEDQEVALARWKAENGYPEGEGDDDDDE